MELARLQEEAGFADSEYLPHAGAREVSQTIFNKYARPRHNWDWRQFAARQLGDVSGKDLLDYGCGIGQEASCFAKLGANVTAIDISEVGVRITRERAEFNGLSDRVHAHVMDATATDFPDASFHLAHGLGILHHVGVREGLAEIHRVLKPGGRAVFLEPLGNVRTVERCKGWLHRRLVNRLDLIRVNDSEENLRYKDITAAAAPFSSFRIYPFRLLFRVRKLFIPRRLYPLVMWGDYWTLKMVPVLRPLAGAAVIEVTK
jgi:ubiquinone/menaquinone biosynthesis C-methylase UbiE